MLLWGLRTSGLFSLYAESEEKCINRRKFASRSPKNAAQSARMTHYTFMLNPRRGDEMEAIFSLLVLIAVICIPTGLGLWLLGKVLIFVSGVR